MRVYVIPSVGAPHPHFTVGDLHDLQQLVGGYIEPVYLPEFEEMGIILLANEEGLLKGLPYNENLSPYFFVGNLIALSYEEDEFTGLDDSQLEYMREWFRNK